MGEVVELHSKRKRQVLKPRTQVKKDRAVNAERLPRMERVASGIKRFALDSLRITAGHLVGLAGRLFWLIQRPISFALMLGTVSMLVLLGIQAANGWPDPQLVLLSIAGLFGFLVTAGGYDRLVRALFNLERRLNGE